tara:strand:- start:1560 stop:3152 length:1593 start_codon:yes stop_codon:yes gene_type:complete
MEKNKVGQLSEEEVKELRNPRRKSTPVTTAKKTSKPKVGLLSKEEVADLQQNPVPETVRTEPPQTYLPAGVAIKEALKNFPGDVLDVGKGYFEAALNPGQTASGILDLIGGGTQEGLIKFSKSPLAQFLGIPSIDQDSPEQQQFRDAIESIPTTGPEFQRFAVKKPFNAALTIAPFTQVGSKIAAAGNFPKVASGLNYASNVLDPLSGGTQWLSKRQKARRPKHTLAKSAVGIPLKKADLKSFDQKHLLSGVLSEGKIKVDYASAKALTAAEKNIGGQMTNLLTAADKSGKYYTLNEVLGGVQELITNNKNKLSPEKLDILYKESMKLAEEFKKSGGRLAPTQLNNLKRRIGYDINANDVDAGGKIVFAEAVRGRAQRLLEDPTTGVKGLKELNIDYGIAKELREAIIVTLDAWESGQTVPTALPSAAAGGAATGTVSPLQAAQYGTGSVAAGKVLRNPNWHIDVAAFLRYVNNKIKEAPAVINPPTVQGGLRAGQVERQGGPSVGELLLNLFGGSVPGSQKNDRKGFAY